MEYYALKWTECLILGNIGENLPSGIESQAIRPSPMPQQAAKGWSKWLETSTSRC